MNALFDQSFARAVAVANRYLPAGLTPREKLVVQLGLHGAHLEEALAAGDQRRASAHAAALVTIAQALSVK